MPVTADSKVLFTGRNKYVVRLTGISSDTTDEADVVKVDKSTLTGPDGTEPGRVVLEKIEWSIQGFTYVLLEWDHTTDITQLVLSGDNYMDFCSVGGLQATGSGGTGDIILSTSGAGAGDTYTITLYCRLKD